MKSFLSPLLQSGGSSLALTNTRHGRLVARTLLTAFDSKSRKKGLLGRDSLPEGSALIIAPCQAIHTFRWALCHRRAVRLERRPGAQGAPGGTAPAHRCVLAGLCRRRTAGRRNRAERHAGGRPPPGLRTVKKLAGSRRIAPAARRELVQRSHTLTADCGRSGSRSVGRREWWPRLVINGSSRFLYNRQVRRFRREAEPLQPHRRTIRAAMAPRRTVDSAVSGH